MIFQAEGFSLSFRRYVGLVEQDEIAVLEGISFGVAAGEVVALIGSSGAGKSLLAHAIFGILPDNAAMTGRLLLEGTVLDAATRAICSGRRMALVPQSIGHLDPMARCLTHLRWAAQRSGAGADASVIEATLRRHQLDLRAARCFPHQLSGGMARRMMFAIATLGDPGFIVADEPTSGLDDDNSDTVLRHLRGMADRGKAILLITHSLAEALPFADRVVLMRDGRVAGIERPYDFAGEGGLLEGSYARSLWRALPENAFAAHATDA